METQYEQECLSVADAVRSMSTAEIESAVDEVYSSGFVQNLHNASTVLAKADQQSIEESQLPVFA
jgi:hypothetical protein